MTKAEQIQKLIGKRGMLRVKDLKAYGIHPENLRRLCQRGLITRVERGVYALPNHDITEGHTLAVVSKRIPNGVVCLISALLYHNLTTQLPKAFWIAISQKDWSPQLEDIPLKVVRFSLASLHEGTKEYDVEGVKVRITTPAKTVADCFKFRNKVGMDVAIEALTEGWRNRSFTSDELWRCAKACRVTNVMRPYMEAIIR